MYSAVKVDGKRLYELARKGEVVERQSRTVTIYGIELLHMDLSLPHPEIEFIARCSKGTYIRTLCVDIGRKLGYPSVMGELVRTSTGGFTREQCVTLEQLAEYAAKGQEAVDQLMIPSDAAVSFLPACYVDKGKALQALQGKRISLTGTDGLSNEAAIPLPDGMNSLLRLYEGERFLGLFRLQEDRHTLVAEKVFLPEDDS
jgi:tRNA pseudouridine55 synthase